MAPPRIKIALPGARAAAAGAALRPASAAPSPALGPGVGSTQAGQAPLPHPSASTRPAGAATGAKVRLSDEARQIALHVNQSFAAGGGGANGSDPGRRVGTSDGAGGGLPKSGPIPLPPPLVAPLPSGEGPPIKKIKLSLKMPNLASLAARIARGEPTAPDDGACGKPGGMGGAGAGGVQAGIGGTDGGGELGAAPGRAQPGLGGTSGVTAGPPRLPFKLKIPMFSNAGSGAAAASGGGGNAAMTTMTKPMIITTTRPAAVNIKPTVPAAAGLDDDEEEDYGPDPDFAPPRRGRGRGRGSRGAAAAGRGSGGAVAVAPPPRPIVSRGGSISGGRGSAVAVVASGSITSTTAAALAAAAGRGRGRFSDSANRFDLERCFEQIVKQDKDGLFAKPVTDEVAPGYSEVRVRVWSRSHLSETS